MTYRSGDVNASVCYTYEEPETEDDFTRKLTIEREQNGKKDTFTEDVYGKIGDTWLVMTDDGRSYLYMELSSENDWKTMEVYDLNGEKVAKARQFHRQRKRRADPDSGCFLSHKTDRCARNIQCVPEIPCGSGRYAGGGRKCVYKDPHCRFP